MYKNLSIPIYPSPSTYMNIYIYMHRMILLTYIKVLCKEPHGAHEVHLVFMTFILKFVMTFIMTHPSTLR